MPGVYINYYQSSQKNRLLDENGDPIEKKTQPVKTGAKRIIEEYSGKIYHSISDASKDTGLSTGMIRDRVYGRIKNDRLKDRYSFKLYEIDDI